MSTLCPEQNSGCGPQIRVSDSELFLLSTVAREIYWASDSAVRHSFGRLNDVCKICTVLGTYGGSNSFCFWTCPVIQILAEVKPVAEIWMHIVDSGVPGNTNRNRTLRKEGRQLQ